MNVGLPWIRLDTAMPDNPKILGLLAEKDGHRAAFVWLSCLCYAGKHETSGFIPHLAIPFVHLRTTDLRLLVTHGLLTEQPGGWLINGWDQYQPTSQTATARSQSARKAAEVRWSKTKDEHA